MITINVKELCRLRGIRYPYASLVKAGISHYVAHEYLKGKKHRVVTQHIEVLCKLLRCTPNDLFVWTPTKPEDDFPQNPMQKIRKKDRADLNKVLDTLDVEDIEEMLRMKKAKGKTEEETTSTK